MLPGGCILKGIFFIMIGIYKITNPEGKVYIGSSANIEKRLRYYNSKSIRKQTKIFESIKKYGFENHKIEILEECDFSDLKQKECDYGINYDVLENGLNSIIPIMGISNLTREKMSICKMGKLNPFFGKKMSEEHKDKIRKFHKGRKHSLEHRKKVSLNNAKINSKIVLHKDTGVFFDSIKDAGYCFSIKHSTLRSKLNGTNKNDTCLIIV